MTQDEARRILAECRDRIDGIDRRILDLLNERTRSVEAIGRAKRELRMPIYEPKREDDVYRNVTENNPGPLPPEAVRRVFERIIDEMRTLQRMRLERQAAESGRGEE
ncbi:MAG: chorismate mutase [Acidobacteria bacterium]|nr:chorismate mutase [Acidobacteriota bacterium]